MYFVSLLNGFSWELDINAWSKTRMIGLWGRERSLMIASAIWIQSTNVMDRWTPDDSKDRAYA